MTPEELQSFQEKDVRYGTLSFAGADGRPDARVFNIGYYQGCYYLHCARRVGEKLKYMVSGIPVCLSMYKESDRVGEDALCFHKSVLVYGRLERMDDDPALFEEMWNGVTAMCEQAGTSYKARRERLEKSIKGIAVFRVVPEETVGKIVVFTSLPSSPTLRMDWKKGRIVE